MIARIQCVNRVRANGGSDWCQEIRHALRHSTRTVQLGWPLGMPVVRKIDTDLWEIRVRIRDGIAWVLFTVEDGDAVLLHGFVKKSRRIPAAELATATQRLRQIRISRRH